MSVCTCCVVHSSCRCCACCWPTFQGESASEPAPGSHTHPGANERSYAPSCGLHQAAQCRQPHAYCRKTNRKRPQKHPQLSSIQTPPFNQVTNEDETQKHHVDFCSLSSSPPVLQQNRQARRVNPTGQCCPTERRMLAWQTLPPGGLGINRSPAGSWFSIPVGVMGAGSSDDESARDSLTKSKRLDDFCSSSNSFYGLNSCTGLSPLCTHRCVDHPTDLCLI